jgi:putative integral membrane protein (TIGR02587 family)
MREPSAGRRFAYGLGRAIGGAAIFALPMLMTMEMWELGTTMSPSRLALLLVATVPLLVGLSHFSGFEETFNFLEDTVDAFVAFAVGFVVSSVMLLVFGVISTETSARDAIARVALQAVPAGIGALLAQSQFGRSDAEEEAEDERRISTYPSQLFVMAVGALFLAFNVAPTEEILLIAYRMATWQFLLLVALALAALHAFVYASRFRGQEQVAAGDPAWSVFLRFTVVGFGIAVAISAGTLWVFGRTDGLDLAQAGAITLVLTFPAALGAAVARLVL